MEIKNIYRFIAILYIMAKFVKNGWIKFKNQTEEKIDGPIEF
jgi:hypothetical protein